MTKTSNPRRATIQQLPDWAIDPTDTPSPARLFTVLALTDFEGGWVRLSAADQRRLIGHAIFGRKAIRSNGHSVDVYETLSFGTDGTHVNYDAADVKAAAARQEILSPSCFGPGVYSRSH